MDSADIYIMVLFRYTGAPYILQLGVTKRAVVDSELRATYISIFNCVDRGVVIDGSLLDEIRCPLLTYLCS